MKNMHAELERVTQALDEAEKKLADILVKMTTKENTEKIFELQAAIYVGKKYRDAIKAKC